MVLTSSRRKRVYTASEVATHSTPADCWVSLLGKVLDVTQLLKENPGPLSQPIIKAAGTDISHWFDSRTGEVRTCVQEETNLARPYMPQGRFIHVPPDDPTVNWSMNFGTPWWRDRKYDVGKLAKKTRLIRIRNVLTEEEDLVEVPCECTVGEIREQYLEYNWHAKSYQWRALVQPAAGSSASAAGAKAEFRELSMTKTLEENGVQDESDEFEDLGMPVDNYVPVVHLYYKDDLTVA